MKERKEFFIEAFTSWEFEDSDVNTVSTNKLTVGLIDKKIAQFLGVKTDPTNPVELDLVVGEIRVKKSTFENHDKYLELIKILGELSKQDFSVSDIGFVEKEAKTNSLLKFAKKQREEELKRELELLRAA